MRNDSERLLLELSEQDAIQQQIRLIISSFKTVEPGPRRKGAMYISHPVSSGKRLFVHAARFGFTEVNRFREEAPERYRRLVMTPNIMAGRRLGELARAHGWPLTIVPGNLYARGWTQVHYMATWRPVIIYRARSAMYDQQDMGWTFGGAEEYKVSILSDKRIYFVEDGDRIVPADLRKGADLVRGTVDRIARMGFDPKLIYEQWQEIDLLVDEARQKKRRSVALTA